jgi:hypothetical protein
MCKMKKSLAGNDQGKKKEVSETTPQRKRKKKGCGCGKKKA